MNLTQALFHNSQKMEKHSKESGMLNCIFSYIAIDFLDLFINFNIETNKKSNENDKYKDKFKYAIVVIGSIQEVVDECEANSFNIMLRIVVQSVVLLLLLLGLGFISFL